MNRKQRRANASTQPAFSPDLAWAQEMFGRGLALHRENKPAEAESYYRQILVKIPDHADALHLLGMALYHQGRARDGIPYVKQALAKLPHFAECYSNLGNMHMALGEYAEAEACLRKAVQLKPMYVDAYNNLGNVLKLQGRSEDAIAAYKQALGVDLRNAEAHTNLGTVLQEQGKLHEAKESLQMALAIQPGLVAAHNSLGIVYYLLGQLKEAEAAYRKAIELDKYYAEAYSNLSVILKKQLKFTEAREALEQAVVLKPGLADAHSNLALLYRDLGRIEDARASYRRALAVKHDPLIALREMLLVSSVVGGVDEITQLRNGLENKINLLAQKPGVIHDPLERGGITLFDLAYHGLDDRPLNESIAHYLTKLCPVLSWRSPYLVTPSSARRIRLGIVSAFLYDHTIGKLVIGMVEKLPRTQFEVVAIHAGEVHDRVSQRIEREADQAMKVPRHVRVAQQMIAEAKLDVLFYPDIGMDTLTYFLAFARLAPIQCVSWGHPVTTGLKSIDYFISSRWIEPEGSEAHYTEQLVKLDELPTYYYRPQLEGIEKTRKDFKLPEDKTLYLCPQSLFKLHPAFDSVLADLLRRDPNGELILIEGYYPEWTQALRKRFEQSMPNVLERVRFIPRVSAQSFLWLLKAADVILDPPYFGGGNTSYEALGVGVPIVTLPGPYMRGRVTAGCYMRMDVTDLIATSAEHYIDLATRLAHDAEWRKHIVSRIEASSGVLYENAAAIDALAAFFSSAVKRAQAS